MKIKSNNNPKQKTKKDNSFAFIEKTCFYFTLSKSVSIMSNIDFNWQNINALCWLAAGEEDNTPETSLSRVPIPQSFSSCLGHMWGKKNTKKQQVKRGIQSENKEKKKSCAGKNNNNKKLLEILATLSNHHKHDLSAYFNARSLGAQWRECKYCNRSEGELERDGGGGASSTPSLTKRLKVDGSWRRVRYCNPPQKK